MFNTEATTVYWLSIKDQFNQQDPQQIREVTVTLLQMGLGGRLNVATRLQRMERRFGTLAPLWPTALIQAASMVAPEDLDGVQDFLLTTIIPTTTTVSN